MRQGDRTLIHLINMSGTSQTGYAAPVTMRDVRIEAAGTFREAETVRNPRRLAVRAMGTYSEIVVPELSDYELVILK